MKHVLPFDPLNEIALHSTVYPKKTPKKPSKTKVYYDEALDNAVTRFDKDPEVIKAAALMQKKHNEIVNEEFSKVDSNWNEDVSFENFREGYEESMRDDDPEEVSLFQYFWLR